MTSPGAGLPPICRACGAADPSIFYEVAGLPTQTCVLLEDRTTAEAYPTGRVALAFCDRCGFIQNAEFAPDLVDYSQPTEESQAFSGRFQEFAESLAADLVDRHGLVGRRVLEVGCGKGDFLVLLARQGIGEGVGIDPGFLPNRDHDGVRLSFIRDFYDESSTGLSGDLVVSRHLMEHVPNVSEFFGWLAASIRRTPGATLFTEVPDVYRVLHEGAFWDVYYEHCSYFTLGSLGRALRDTGMTVTDLRMGFENQYLLSEARHGTAEAVDVPDDIARTAEAVEFFSGAARDQIEHWRDRIRGVRDRGAEVAVWGGGSKAVAFLSTLGMAAPTVVDINPHKQGKWLPGAAVEVSAPQVLREVDPQLVIAMNPIYLDEIGRDLKAMGLDPELAAV